MPTTTSRPAARPGGLHSLLLRAPWPVVRLLNLPVDRQEWEATRTSGQAPQDQQARPDRHLNGHRAGAATSPDPGTHASAHANPYLDAAQLQPAAARPDSMSWQAAPPPLQRQRWYTIVRALLVVLVLLLSWLGLRAIFRPPQASVVAAEALPAGLQYPAAAASGVAERFTAAYLTWNETSPDSRSGALAAAGWAGDPKIGWNGKGRQAVVGQVAAVAVDATRQDLGSITTVAQVDVWPRAATGYAAKPERRTLALRVPVGVTGTGPSLQLGVAAAPALVAPPAAAPPEPATVADPDDDLAAATRAGAEAFFTAYANDTDLAAITAPGAQIAGLGGGVAYARTTAWQVATPTDPDQTTAVAGVVWTGVDGSETAQTYNLTLRKVASGTTSRWQVYAIT